MTVWELNALKELHLLQHTRKQNTNALAPGWSWIATQMSLHGYRDPSRAGCGQALEACGAAVLLATIGAGRYLCAYATCDATPPSACAMPWATEIVATGWLYTSQTQAGFGDVVPRQPYTTNHVCKIDMEICTMLQTENYHLDDIMNSETCAGPWREGPPSIKFNVTRCTFPKTEAFSEWRAVRPPRPARSAPTGTCVRRVGRVRGARPCAQCHSI